MPKSIFALMLTVVCTLTQAADLSAPQQAKVDGLIREVTAWAAEPNIVEAVRTQNKNRPADHASMDQQKWTELPVVSPFIRSFTQNTAAEVLKAKRVEAVTEAFISDASGTKVAFLAKPSNWSHKGKPKHDQPMSGRPWQGPVETDSSTGYTQLQISVPVLDGGKAIGSLVVGLNVAKL